MIIDSHCHLNILPESLGGMENVLAQAEALGVERMLCIAIGPDKWSDILALTERYEQVYAAIGVHPCEPPEVVVSDAQLLAAASHPKVLAIGEIGLDYFHFDPQQQAMDWQQARFRQQIRIAKQLKKPIIIHNRHSTADCLRLLAEENAQEVGGIMHCFVEDLAVAEQAMALGFYLSFSGILTFKNATDVKAVVQALPLERILVETDSPYLAPVPYRGKVNQPAYTHYVVQEIADLKQLPFEVVAQATTDNFNRLFGTHF